MCYTEKKKEFVESRKKKFKTVGLQQTMIVQLSQNVSVKHRNLASLSILHRVNDTGRSPH